MFRRRTGQETPEFDASTGDSLGPTPAAASNHTPQQEQNLASTIASVRQEIRRRTSDTPSQSPSNASRGGQLAPLRARVQQPPGSPSPAQQLAPLQRQRAANSPNASPGGTQGFSVFSNPLSSQPNPNAQRSLFAAGARQPAALQQQSAAAPAAAAAHRPHQQAALPMADQQVLQAPSNVPVARQQQAAGLQQPQQQQSAAQGPPDAGSESAGHPAAETAASTAGADAVAASDSPSKQGTPEANKALRFEVLAAVGDYGSHDQELLGAEHLPSDDAATQQQYVYDEDTGQLMRVGEGADTTRLARHYLEDWNTGDFHQLAQPRSRWSCLARLRRKPTTAPTNSWGNAAQEPSLLRSLADFTDTMGSGMAALGMFAQGLAGGLALLSLFMTYLQYATMGINGFLGYYSAHAQMVNRAFFTLISLSLISAASRLAYDKLGSYRPTYLRLRLVDGLVIACYIIAYICNLVATPIDDQLTYEARRSLTYYTLPLQPSFLRKVTLWHALNLIRIICCGLAWALACYRGNPYVMMLIFEARKQQEADEAAGGFAGHFVARRTLSAGTALADAGRQPQQQGLVGRFLAAEQLNSTGMQQPRRFSDNAAVPLQRGGSGLPVPGAEDCGVYSAAGGQQYNSSTGVLGRRGIGRPVAPTGSAAGTGRSSLPSNSY